MNIDDKKLDRLLKNLADMEQAVCREIEDNIIVYAKFKQGLTESEISQVETHLKDCKRCQQVHAMALEAHSPEKQARIAELSRQIYKKQFGEMFKKLVQQGKDRLDAFLQATGELVQPTSLAFAHRKGGLATDKMDDRNLKRKTTYTLGDPSPQYEINIPAKANYQSILLARDEAAELEIVAVNMPIETAGRDHKVLQELIFEETELGINTLFFFMSENPLDIDAGRQTASFEKMIEILGDQDNNGAVSMEAIVVDVQKGDG